MKTCNWKRITLIVVLVILALIVVTGVGATMYVKSFIGDIQGDDLDGYDLSLSEVDGYTNILLLGVDSRDMSDMENTRSDAIMVISINDETGGINIASVYRDTYLKLGDLGYYDKITHACMVEGPELVMKTLNQSMDIDISEYVMVNFKAVADIVDAVGGIEVEVFDYEINQLNKYTKQTAANVGVEEYQLVEAPGVQTLEGVQAVAYSRIRYGVGDDFKRTERMRTVLMKVFDKLQSSSVGEMMDVVDIMRTQVKTSMGFDEVLSLGTKLTKLDIKDNIGWPYDVSTGLIKGVSYVIPRDLAANTTRLHKEFFNQEDYVAPEHVVQMSYEIAASK